MSSKQKTLLLLGGSAAQIAAIEKASALGYRTVLCDYLPDNPGQYVADAFHLVSTTDKDAVLAVAEAEGIDGIVAYSSDPAAPTAAYVARELDLPGVPYESARVMCEKHLFRSFLSERGFNVPGSTSCRVGETPDVTGLAFPLIVKPTDSSGSKGVRVIREESELPGALVAAAAYSRSGVIEIEEFVERDHPHVIEAEVFAADGKVVSWGLMNSIRDAGTNPLLPAGYTLPLDLSAARKDLVRAEVSRLVAATGVLDGAFNIEMVIDSSDRLFFIDAGPRNGGNMLPEYISMASGTDLVGATVRAAMGDLGDTNLSFDGTSGGFWGLGVLHADKDGVFRGVDYSPEARTALVREELGVAPGDTVRRFSKCTDLIGLAFFRFGSKEESDAVMLHMASSMRVVVE